MCQGNKRISDRYFIVNKPYNMVSQFISPDSVRLLSDLDFRFPEGTHAIGRLDNESEGLIILTTNKKVTRLMHNRPDQHTRVYLVMVQNKVTRESLVELQTGIIIKSKGGIDYTAIPEEVQIITEPLKICAQASDPREKYPHTWLLITLKEGKFRQVRKMVMAVHHRCLRLIRVSINNLTLVDLQPGQVKELNAEDFAWLAGIEYSRL